ncbi:MAG TPA: hypothetical protein ENJ82_15115, partial [Bacteroidetes bacterium]|nr:hypothetical protein [Bacteroidota bacterium]
MTITYFLIICLLAILFLAIAFGGGLARQGRDAGIRQRIYAGIWLMIGISAVMLINRYLYPANKTDVFGNTDYHVLEHQGYRFTDSVKVADARHSARALWDNLSGQGTLIGGEAHKLRLDSFFQPVFLENKGIFSLENPVYPEEIEEGFTLWQGDSLLLALKISPYARGDSMRYEVAFGVQDSFVTSHFKAHLVQGYPLADLLRHTDGWQAHDSLVRLCEGAWLLREQQHHPESHLLFFPSRDLFCLSLFSFNQSRKSEKSTKEAPAKQGRSSIHTIIEIPENARFFTGLGMAKSPVMKVKTAEGKYRLEFDFSRKYRLDHQESNQLFLCSDLRDVSQNVTQGGFLYPVFEEEENSFHVNATLRYAHGTARERLEIAVVDEQMPAKKGPLLVKGGDEFLLQARDERTGLQWIMRLTDLRADNPIGRNHLFGFLGGFLLLVL